MSSDYHPARLIQKKWGSRLSSFDLDPFFLFSESKPARCIADLAPDAPYESQKIVCPTFRYHRRGRRISPLDMVVPCKSPPDVIFTWMTECLIQERVKRIFEEERLTGFITLPAKARVEKTGMPLDVSELMITGWGGMAPPASGIREVERCQDCGHLVYSPIEEPRELINPKNWDGSDFFMIWPLPRFHFVTERVVEVCKKHGVSGVTFERNFPTRSGRIKSSGYTPGRLSYYMPTERAHALGDPLGIF
jgi:hypothetical protein